MGRFVGSIRIRSFGGLKKVSLFTVFAIAVLGFCWAGPAHATDKLIVKDSGGNTKFVVRDDGTVGVNNPTAYGYELDISAGLPTGTPLSYAQLHFSPDGTDTGGWINSGSANNFWMSSGATVEGGQWVQKSSDGQAVIAGSGASGFKIFTTSGNTVNQPVSMTQRLKIDYSGNLTVNSLAGTGNRYVCVNSSGTIYASATACQ